MTDDEIKLLVRNAFRPYARGFLREPSASTMSVSVDEQGTVLVTLTVAEADEEVLEQSIALRTALQRALSNLTLFVDGRDALLEIEDAH